MSLNPPAFSAEDSVRRKLLKFLENIKTKIENVSEEDIHGIALSISMETHCRAVDSYFVATAKFTDSILITNDKVMANNAKKSELKPII